MSGVLSRLDSVHHMQSVVAYGVEIEHGDIANTDQDVLITIQCFNIFFGT